MDMATESPVDYPDYAGPPLLECSGSTNSVMVPSPPLNPADFDSCFYFGQDLSQIQQPWSEDRAFWPTVLTYGFTFVVGLVGNALVMFALLADRKSRNVTSSFLVSLAVADMTFLLICVPYGTIAKLSHFWSGGTVLCKLAGFVEMLSASASVLNLTAVSVERYAVIVHPMKSRSWCTMGKTKRIIIGVWIVAIALSSPLLYIMDTEVTLYYNRTDHVTTLLCSDRNLEVTSERVVFAWYQMLVMFLVPVLVMVFCYTVVIHVLWISTKQLARMTNTTDSSGTDDDCSQRLTSSSPNRHHMRSTKVILSRTVKDHSAEIREARKQVIKMLLAIITVFFLCWGPKLVFNLMKRHEMAAMHTDMAFYSNLIISLLPYIQSCSNPIIYSFMSKNFRRSMRTGCRICCQTDACTVCSRDHRHLEFDMETKSANGTSMGRGRYSPSQTSRTMGRSYVTVTSDI